MDESGIKEQKIQSEITKVMDGFPYEAKAHKIIHDCAKQGKLILFYLYIYKYINNIINVAATYLALHS